MFPLLLPSLFDYGKPTILKTSKIPTSQSVDHRRNFIQPNPTARAKVYIFNQIAEQQQEKVWRERYEKEQVAEKTV